MGSPYGGRGLARRKRPGCGSRCLLPGSSSSGTWAVLRVLQHRSPSSVPLPPWKARRSSQLSLCCARVLPFPDRSVTANSYPKEVMPPTATEDGGFPPGCLNVPSSVLSFDHSCILSESFSSSWVKAATVENEQEQALIGQDWTPRGS